MSDWLSQAACCLQVDRHVDNMTIRITQPAQQLEIAKKLAQKGLQPRKLYLSSCGSREAATQPLVSDEFRHMLGRVNDLTLFHTQSLTEEMLQARHGSQSLLQLDSVLPWPAGSARGYPSGSSRFARALASGMTWHIAACSRATNYLAFGST
jgi:hypothetical protein